MLPVAVPPAPVLPPSVGRPTPGEPKAPVGDVASPAMIARRRRA